MRDKKTKNLSLSLFLRRQAIVKWDERFSSTMNKNTHGDHKAFQGVIASQEQLFIYSFSFTHIIERRNKRKKCMKHTSARNWPTQWLMVSPSKYFSLWIPSPISTSQWSHFKTIMSCNRDVEFSTTTLHQNWNKTLIGSSRGLSNFLNQLKSARF